MYGKFVYSVENTILNCLVIYRKERSTRLFLVLCEREFMVYDIMYVYIHSTPILIPKSHFSFFNTSLHYTAAQPHFFFPAIILTVPVENEVRGP